LDFLTYFTKLTKERENNGINYETWLSVSKHIEKFTGGTIIFKDVTEVWMNRFKDYLLTKVSQNSAHNYFNKVKAALHRAYKEKVITDNPADKVKSPKQIDTHREYLTLEELQKLVETNCEIAILKKAFLFSALTGLRWSDIVQLKWGNIQHSLDHGWKISFRQAKTKGHEYLPISDQARELIGDHKHYEEKVFAGLKYSAWYNLKLAQWVMRAGTLPFIVQDIHMLLSY
jgi:integrase